MDPVAYQLGNIDARLAELEKRSAAQDTKLDTVVAFVEREKGARRLALLLSSGLGALAALTVSLFTGREAGG